MSGPKPLKLTKPVSFYKRALKIEPKDFFIALFKMSANLATGGISTALIGDTLDTGSAFRLEQTVEEKAYLWIHRSITRTCFNVLVANQRLLGGSVIGEEEVKQLIDGFEKSTADLLIEIDERFFKDPARLVLFQEVERHYRKFLALEGVDERLVEAFLLQLRKRFHFELYDEFQENRKQYGIISEYFDNLMNPAFLQGIDHYPPELNTLPKVPVHLVGREEEIQGLFDMLKAGSRALLNGLGGIGKTALALEFVHRYKHNYDHVIWISGTETGENDSLALRILADRVLTANLGFERDQDLSPEENVRRLLNSLQKVGGDNLLVLDAVSGDLSTLIDSVPANGWKILITSRTRILNFPIVAVDHLPDAAAKILFQRYHPYPIEEEEEVARILGMIWKHPLTIVLLSKVLEEKAGRLSIREARQLLEEDQLRATGLQVNVTFFPLTANPPENEVEIFSYLLSIFKLSGLSDEEIRVLRDFSVFPPAPIEERLIAPMLDLSAPDVDRYFTTARKLSEKSWLIRDRPNLTYACHQLIQEVVRFHYPPRFDDHNRYLGFLIGNLRHPDLEKKVSLLPFVESAISCFSSDFPEMRIWRLSLSAIYKEIGAVRQSEALMENIGPLTGDLESLATSVYLQKAEIAMDMGKIEEAEALFLQALSSADEQIAAGHPGFIPSKMSILEKIGDFYFRQDNIEKALQYYQQQERQTEENRAHFFNDTSYRFFQARAQYGLGRTSKGKKNIAEAIDHLRRSTAILEGILESGVLELENRFDGIRSASIEFQLGLSYSMLSDCYMDSSDHVLAYEFLAKDLELAQKAYSQAPMSEPAKREFATSLGGLGHFLAKTGRNREALKIYISVNNIHKELYEHNADSTINIFNLVCSFEKVFEVQKALGDEQNALQPLSEGFNLARTLAAHHPAVRKYFEAATRLAVLAIQSNIPPAQKMELAHYVIGMVKGPGQQFMPPEEQAMILLTQSSVIGGLSLQSGQYENAVEAYVFGLYEISPFEANPPAAYRITVLEMIITAYRGLGMSFVKLNNIEEGLKCFKSSVVLADQLFRETQFERFKELRDMASSNIQEVNDLMKPKSCWDSVKGFFKRRKTDK